MISRLLKNLNTPAAKLLRYEIQLLVAGILIGASPYDIWPLLVGLATVVITGVSTVFFAKMFVRE